MLCGFFTLLWWHLLPFRPFSFNILFFMILGTSQTVSFLPYFTTHYFPVTVLFPTVLFPLLFLNEEMNQVSSEKVIVKERPLLKKQYIYLICLWTFRLLNVSLRGQCILSCLDSLVFGCLYFIHNKRSAFFTCAVFQKNWIYLWFDGNKQDLNQVQLWI